MLLSYGGYFEYISYASYLVNRFDSVSDYYSIYLKVYKFDKSKPIKEWVYHSTTYNFYIGYGSLDSIYYDFYYVSYPVYFNRSHVKLADRNTTDYIRVSMALGYFQYYFNKYKNQILIVGISCMSSLILLKLLGRWSRNKNSVIKSYKRKYRGGKKIWRKRKKFY